MTERPVSELFLPKPRAEAILTIDTAVHPAVFAALVEACELQFTDVVVDSSANGIVLKGVEK